MDGLTACCDTGGWRESAAANAGQTGVIRLLVITPDPDLRSSLADAFLGHEARADFIIRFASNAAAAAAVIEGEAADAALIHLGRANVDGLDALDRLLGRWPSLAVAAVTNPGERHVGLSAVRHGAQEFVSSDAPADALRAAVRNAIDRGAVMRETKDLHAAVLAAERAVEEMKLMRRFVDMVSHEFRTPMAVIVSACDRLQRVDGGPDPAARKALKKIRRAVTRQSELIESMLAASRMESGRLQIRPERTNVAVLAEQACLRKADLCDTHKILFENAAAEVCAEVDPSALGHVLDNLISNAIKYSPRAQTVRVRLSEAADEVTIAVIDQGIGVPDEDRERVWERFFRAGNAHEVVGTGVGLDLVRLFAEAHGGRAELDSALGEGSTFSVTLPRTLAAVGKEI